MKINLGQIVAIVIVVAVTGWVFLSPGGKDQDDGNAQPVALEQNELPRVQVEWKEAKLIEKTLSLNGETAAQRMVQVRSESSGRIIKIYKNKGDQVSTGDVLVEVDPGDLRARIKSAKAQQEQRRLELEGTKRLVNQGLQNTTQLAGAEALYEAAKAQTVGLELQLKHTVIRAPFSGYLNDRPVELGSYIGPGDPVAEILDFEPMIVRAQVSENEVTTLTEGMTAIAKLVDGRSLDGKVTFISANANPATRTFTIEMEISEQVGSPVAGSTASILVPTESVRAHFISPALLNLDDDGKVGLKILDSQDRVVFLNVEIAESTPQGVWVTGMADSVKLITVGQGFVNSGEKVEPVFTNESSNSSSNSVIADANK